MDEDEGYLNDNSDPYARFRQPIDFTLFTLINLT